jgi:hypothetical protein
MRRSLGLLAFAALAGGGCSDETTIAPFPLNDPPHLVLVSIDTLRADCVLGQGPRRARTPTLDALARDGLALANVHAHVPLTLPSHATLFTGRLPPALGLHDNSPFPLSPDVPTLPAWLRERGFATAAVIGGQPLGVGSGIERGFDRYDAPPRGAAGSARFGERRAAEVTDLAIAEWSREVPGRRFLFVHYFDPHAPYDPPPECVEPGKSDDVARYLGEVAYVDRELARLVAELRQRGQRVVLAILSDHGEGLGDHGERTHGYQVFESTMRVPVLLAELEGARTATPKTMHALERERLIGMVDLLPTLLREMHVELPPSLAGRTLQEYPPEGAAEPPPPACYVESLAGSLHFGWAQITGVRLERATLVRGGAGVPRAIDGLGVIRAGAFDEIVLADLGRDPPPDDVLSSGREALVAARAVQYARGGEDPSSPHDEPRLAPLIALAYVGGAEDAERHEMLPFELNAALPSPIGRREQVDALLLAVERLEQGDPNAAVIELTKLLDADPGNRAALFFRARARLRLETGDGRSARAAAADLATLRALEPSYGGAALLHAKALAQSGEWDAAFAEIARLETQGEDAEVEQLAGSMLVQDSAAGRRNLRLDPERGYARLVRAVELDPAQEKLARDLEQQLSRLAQQRTPPPWAGPLLARVKQARR